MSEISIDPELSAMQTIIAALETLDAEARQRVISYVFKRLRITIDNQPPQVLSQVFSPVAESTQPAFSRQTVQDIRSLKEQKAPRSANEMCAIVAYYLAEVAPVEERKDSIDKDDVIKYFKQANFPLPKALRQIMPNASKSGLF